LLSTSRLFASSSERKTDMPGKDKVICPKEVTTAITNLRKSLVSTCYVVVGYSNKNTLTVVAEGEVMIVLLILFL